MNPRSYLFVPGNRPDMLAKATGRGADAVIVDLEDAVPPGSKDETRAEVARWLSEPVGARGEVWVRVNNAPELLADDLSIPTERVTECSCPRWITRRRSTGSSGRS